MSTEEQRRKWREQSKRWREANPEKAKINRAAKKRRYYAKHADRLKAESSAYAKATGYASRKAWKERIYSDPGKLLERRILDMLGVVRRRAEKRGLDFNLVPEDIVIPETCPILGIPLAFARGVRGGWAASPAVDRIDNAKGYVRGNVAVISHRANLMKSNATLEEMRAVVAYMEKYQ
jgi:hypothetical protein